ncbi:unnamed protein product [Acidithrix sp. C25]|nr:unnamed protein product [Acidithrix sp. C25]
MVIRVRWTQSVLVIDPDGTYSGMLVFENSRSSIEIAIIG